jgi:hypothetical protein
MTYDYTTWYVSRHGTAGSKQFRRCQDWYMRLSFRASRAILVLEQAFVYDAGLPVLRYWVFSLSEGFIRAFKMTGSVSVAPALATSPLSVVFSPFYLCILLLSHVWEGLLCIYHDGCIESMGSTWLGMTG